MLTPCRHDAGVINESILVLSGKGPAMSFSRRLLDYESYIRFRHEGLGIIAGDAVALGLLAKPGPFPRDP